MIKIELIGPQYGFSRREQRRDSVIIGCDSYEIIEEDKKIEKLHLRAGSTTEYIYEHREKINELVDSNNKLLDIVNKLRAVE